MSFAPPARPLWPADRLLWPKRRVRPLRADLTCQELDDRRDAPADEAVCPQHARRLPQRGLPWRCAAAGRCEQSVVVALELGRRGIGAARTSGRPHRIAQAARQPPAGPQNEPLRASVLLLRNASAADSRRVRLNPPWAWPASPLRAVLADMIRPPPTAAQRTMRRSTRRPLPALVRTLNLRVPGGAWA